MKAAKAEDIEIVAALRLIDRRAAVLGVPFYNPLWQHLIDRGLASITRQTRQLLNRRWYDCVHVSITDKGRKVLNGGGE